MGERLKHLDRRRSQGYDVSQDPVLVDPALPFDVAEHRFQCDDVSVEVSHRGDTHLSGP